MSSHPRFVLAGNNLAGCMVFDLLVEAAGTKGLLAIAPPGGVHHPWQPSLATHAHAHGVRCLQPDDVNGAETVAEIGAFGPSLLLSIYYTQIFKPPLLEAVGGPAINMHPSLLPRHRGTAPIIWAIADGDQQTGLSAHLIDDGIDTGELILQQSLPIHPDDTGYGLHLRMAHLVRGCAARILRTYLSAGELPEARAQAGTASYHSSADPPLNHLDFRESCEHLRNIVRALAPPLPGAFAYSDHRRITLERVTILDPGRVGRPRAAGMIQHLPGGEVVVWASDGPLRLDGAVIDGETVAASALAGVPALAEGTVLV